MGYFYVGFDYKNRKNGYLKIGETGCDLSARLSNIRHYDCFQCLGYLVLKNETKARRVYVESYVRMEMEDNFPELKQVQNDHFTYNIPSASEKYEQAEQFAKAALKFAIQACEFAKIEYEIGTKTFKRG